MNFLFDTNACIAYLNNHLSPIRRKLEQLSPSQIFVCSVVKAELFYGAMKSFSPRRTLVCQQEFLSRFVSLPFDDSAAEAYARVRSELERTGTPIGANDLMIAAIALCNNATLITHNTKEFTRVKDLIIEDWESES